MTTSPPLRARAGICVRLVLHAIPTLPAAALGFIPAHLAAGLLAKQQVFADA